jgi:5-methylcytosine-specific restriction endonuclease McrBC GTP-binding regulatory subunit McrB
MNKPFSQLIEIYKEHLLKDGLEQELYKWDLVKKFKGKPNVAATDFEAEIKGMDYNNLIYGMAHAVKNHLANARAEDYRECYKLLFDESKPLMERVNYFTDETLKLYRAIGGALSHHHDERTIATILTFYNPDKYIFYKSTLYSSFCRHINIKPKTKKGEKYIHYLELMNDFIENYIKIDQELIQVFSELLPDHVYKDLNHKLLAQDIIYYNLEVLPKKQTPEQKIKFETTSTEKADLLQVPLNQILYGPPGTGKTYNSIDLAVKIAKPKAYKASEPKTNRKLYEELVKQNRVVFTTFHQSTSYEDFIEGIKPVLNDEGKDGNLGFEISPGVFQRICNSARTIKNTKSNVAWKNANFFKMSLGGKSRNDLHQYCIENNVIGLLWGGSDSLKPLKKHDTWQEYKKAFAKSLPDLVKESKFNIQSTYAFLHSMKVGDIVVASKGNYIIDAIGKVTSDYFHDDIPQIDFNHFRKVEWIATGLNANPAKFFKKQISQMAIYNFAKDDIKKEAFEDITSSSTNTETAEQPYVLIIDEINRGNVAQIFGELITLIEPDKRDGMNNAISVQLPYSKESFTVPSNLYIIGTMNTADRSVEALDTALRRRFSFKEMMPEPKLLSPSMVHARFWQSMANKYGGTIKQYKEFEENLWKLLTIDISDEAAYLDLGDNKYKHINSTEELAIELDELVEYSGINLSELLEAINARIEVLLDRDHRIGHSYFMQVYSLADLLEVMYDKVIPLLQEYFYNDYNKIAMVIGTGFLNVKKEHNIVFAEIEDSIASDFESKVLIDIKPAKDVNLNTALDLLFNLKA